MKVLDFAFIIFLLAFFLTCFLTYNMTKNAMVDVANMANTYSILYTQFQRLGETLLKCIIYITALCFSNKMFKYQIKKI